MRVMSGKVVEGKVVVEGTPLTEGSLVAILATEDGEGFDLSAEEEAELLLAIAEAERGETVSGEAMLERLVHRSS